MSDSKSVLSSGRRLQHPLEIAFANGQMKAAESIIQSFGAPPTWDLCCQLFDRKANMKEGMVNVAHTIIRSIDSGFLNVKALRDFCVTLLNRHLVYKSQWREDRTARVLSLAEAAYPEIFDQEFCRTILLAALRSESVRLLGISKIETQALEPVPDLVFALCEGSGALLDVVFTSFSNWSDDQKMMLMNFYLDCAVIGHRSGEAAEVFIGSLIDRGMPNGYMFPKAAFKSQCVRKVMISRKMHLTPEQVQGVAKSSIMEFCMGGIIGFDESGLKESALESELAEDLGL